MARGRRGLWTERSVPLGRYSRSRPLVFSLRAALLGAVGVGEVDLDAGRGGDLGVPGHLDAAVPGQGLGEPGRQGFIWSMTAVRPGRRTTLGQVQQGHVAGGRSTMVPTAEFEAVEPLIRSPSWWPGTRRPSTSSGRSWIETRR